MSTHAERLMKLVGALAVPLVLLAPGPAAAQEWKIYLHGRVEPIVANFYSEEAPWIFYRDDASQYVFAIGCDRVQRVERGGTPIPQPRCPVDRLPSVMPIILMNIMDLEFKRLDDSVTKLREQTTAWARARVATFAVTGEAGGAGRPVEPAGGGRGDEAVSFFASELEGTLGDITITLRRLDALQRAAKGYPERERQRYFFAPR